MSTYYKLVNNIRNNLGHNVPTKCHHKKYIHKSCSYLRNDVKTDTSTHKSLPSILNTITMDTNGSKEIFSFYYLLILYFYKEIMVDNVHINLSHLSLLALMNPRIKLFIETEILAFHHFYTI